MAEGLGTGRRTEDRRRSGAARRVVHTVQGDNDMVGDKRHLRKKPESPGASGGRSVPIAQTLGAGLERRSNGSGRRVAPSSMLSEGRG